MIDLHMHTTASDGRCSPEQLVDHAWLAGIRTMAVTDHDTLAGIPAAAAAARSRGMAFIPGIEITSVDHGRDVHILAYFVSEAMPGLHALLTKQRRHRLERALEIAAKLEGLGAPIDTDAMTAAATAPGGKSLARPQIAELLIDAGHVATVTEAFARFLGEGNPAFVPHRGASPAEVVELVSRGGAAASLAHPGYRGSGPSALEDDLVPALRKAGLVALEAFHSSHDAQAQAHYVALARAHGMAVTGGSDYHGPGTRRSDLFGKIHLPLEHFEEFARRAAATTSASV